jgi:MYXO-CTERM domain-containing protein
MLAIRSVGAALTLAGIATFAGAATPALASGPQIDVTPSVAAPGAQVTFSIACGPGAVSATLFGTTLGLSEQIPMQASTHWGVFVTTVTLPLGISPGGYAPSLDCSNGVSGTGALQVNALPVQPTTPAAVPSGAPRTRGGSTSTAMGGPLSAVGAGLLGLGGLGAVVAIRRRKAHSGN